MQIILKLTTECNLACSYCSEGDKKPAYLPEKFFYKLVDDMAEFSEAMGNTRYDFLFHGGEPTLYGRKRLKSLIRYAKERLQGYEIKFLMQTNGVLLDEAWTQFFKQESIGVGVSLDGYPEIHDKYRLTKAKEPTAKRILSNIKNLQKAGLNAGTLMVLNSAEDIDVQKLFDFLQENDLSPKIHPVIPCGRAFGREDASMVYKKYVNLMKKLFELALKNNMKNRIQPLDELMDAILGAASVSECSFNGSCGKNFICLYPDGAVGFCGRARDNKELIYGNVTQNSLLELYNSPNAKRLRERQNYLKEHDCKDCADWEFCRGGCAFEALNAFGKIEAKYPNCSGRRELLKYLRTEGLKILKEALVQEKIKRRKNLNSKKILIKQIEDVTLDEVIKRDGNAP